MLKRHYPLITFVLFIIIFQIFATTSGAEYYLTQLTMTAYYSIIVIGLSALMGYAGQISIGHAAFFSIGGYTTAVLTTINLIQYSNSSIIQFLINAGLTTAGKDPYGVELIYLSPWISLFAAIIITIVISALIGIPILKLKGHYLAMATLGFGTIIYRVVLGSEIFGEADGISDVPAFDLFQGLSITGDSSLRVSNYYIAWFVVIIAIILLMNLINSRTGRALRSIHGNEEAANAMGVNTSGYKLSIFVLSAVMAAIAGVFLTHFNGGIGPSEAGVMKSVRYVAIVAVGGMANLWGVLLMGLILNFISLRGYLGSYDDAFFGLILIIFIMFFPDGIFSKNNYKKIIKYIKKFGNSSKNKKYNDSSGN